MAEEVGVDRRAEIFEVFSRRTASDRDACSLEADVVEPAGLVFTAAAATEQFVTGENAIGSR